MRFNIKNIFQRQKTDKNLPEVPGTELPATPPSSQGMGDQEIIEAQIKAIEEERNEEDPRPGGSLKQERSSHGSEGVPSSLPVVEKEETPAASPSTPVTPSSWGDGYREKVGDTMPSPSVQTSPGIAEEKMEIHGEKGLYERDQNQEKKQEPEMPIPEKAEEGAFPGSTVAIEDETGPDLFRPEKNTAKFVRFGIIGLVTFIILGGGAFAGVWLFRSFLATPPLPEKEASQPPLVETPPEQPAELTLAERDSKRVDDLDRLAAALSRYHDAFNSYPSTNGSLEKTFKDTAASSILARGLVPNYISAVPSDPTANFYYGYNSDGPSYELTSLLENKDHAECVVSGNYCVRTIRNGEVVSRK